MRCTVFAPLFEQWRDRAQVVSHEGEPGGLRSCEEGVVGRPEVRTSLPGVQGKDRRGRSMTGELDRDRGSYMLIEEEAKLRRWCAFVSAHRTANGLVCGTMRVSVARSVAS